MKIKIKKIKDIVKKPIFIRPLVASCIAILLTSFLASDVNSDMFLSTVCGSSDIEVSDFYNRVRAGSSKKSIDEKIVVVNIDSVFERAELAILLDAVAEQNPKALCLDVIFAGEKDSEGDELLSSCMRNIPNLVVSQQYNDFDYAPMRDFTSEFSPETKRGMANLTSSTHHGIVREVTPFFGEKKEYPCLAAAILSEVSPEQYEKLQKREGDELIRFQPEEFYVYEPTEVFENEADLKGKIVFLGTIDEEGDLHRTALSEDYPGVLIQANILSMMLRGDYVNTNSKIYNFILALLSCILVTVLYVYLDKAQNFVMRIFPIVWMIVIVFIGCWSFNEYGIYLDAPQTIILAALSLVVLDTWYAFENPIRKLLDKILKRNNQLIGMKV